MQWLTRVLTLLAMLALLDKNNRLIDDRLVFGHDDRLITYLIRQIITSLARDIQPAQSTEKALLGENDAA